MPEEPTLLPGRSEAVMPVSSDSLLLAEFVEAANGERALELGCGTGVVALTLASRVKLDVVGIDISIEAVETAEHRAAKESDLLVGTCRFLPGDLRHESFIRELGLFEHVVCNPPYYKVGNGRLPAHPDQTGARHETSCQLEDVAQAAAWALPPGGALWMIHIPARLAEIFSAFEARGFSVTTLRPVYTRDRARAELILLRAVRGSDGPLRLLEPRRLRAINKMP